VTFLGSEEDVLDRYYRAASFYDVDVIVRVSADRPFQDPEVIDRAVRIFKEAVPPADFVANCSYDGSIKVTYPEGLDIEVFSFACLEKMWANAKRPSEREHVTSYVFNNPRGFRIVGFENDQDLSHMRWTIDYESDLVFAREIYKCLYPKKEIFLMRDILEVLDAEPELAEINTRVPYHEGYIRSVQNELASQGAGGRRRAK
jgi:spore coat polysaccharide biosynthesis protein SpsF (cytidylyltransferase family)